MFLEETDRKICGRKSDPNFSIQVGVRYVMSDLVQRVNPEIEKFLNYFVQPAH